MANKTGSRQGKRKQGSFMTIDHLFCGSMSSTCSAALHNLHGNKTGSRQGKRKQGSFMTIDHLFCGSMSSTCSAALHNLHGNKTGSRQGKRKQGSFMTSIDHIYREADVLIAHRRHRVSIEIGSKNNFLAPSRKLSYS
jgi:hypothetical protein